MAVTVLLLLIAAILPCIHAEPAASAVSQALPVWAIAAIVVLFVAVSAVLGTFFFKRRFRLGRTKDKATTALPLPPQASSTPRDESTLASHIDIEKPPSHKEICISLPYPPQSTFLFSDKLELGSSDDAAELYQKYMNETAGTAMHTHSKRASVAATLKNTLRQSLRLQRSSKTPLSHVAFDPPSQQPQHAAEQPISKARRSLSMKKKAPSPDSKLECSNISCSSPVFSDNETIQSRGRSMDSEQHVVVVAESRPIVPRISDQYDRPIPPPPPPLPPTLHPTPASPQHLPPLPAPAVADHAEQGANAERAARQVIQHASVRAKHRADTRQNARDCFAQPAENPFASVQDSKSREIDTTTQSDKSLDDLFSRAPEPATTAPAASADSHEPAQLPSPSSAKDKPAETSGHVDPSLEAKCELPDDFDVGCKVASAPVEPVGDERLEIPQFRMSAELSAMNIFDGSDSSESEDDSVEASADDNKVDDPVVNDRSDDPATDQTEQPESSSTSTSINDGGGDGSEDALPPPPRESLPRNGSVQNIIHWWQKESSLRSSDSDRSINSQKLPPTHSGDAATRPTLSAAEPTAFTTASNRSSILGTPRATPPASLRIGNNTVTSPRASLGSLSRTSAAERMKILANSSVSSNTSHVGSLRRKLQAAGGGGGSPTHSNNNSANSSLREPPAGLVSLSSRAQQSYRPAMPFMSEEEFEAPVPTASFSSSTVRTMIPADEYVGPGGGASIVDTGSNTGSLRNNPLHQRQPQHQQATGTKAAPAPAPAPTPSSAKARTPSPTPARRESKDDIAPKRDTQTYTTVRGGKRSRGSIPWLPDSATAATAKAANSKKTPAQKERDRYLQSLK